MSAVHPAEAEYGNLHYGVGKRPGHWFDDDTIRFFRTRLGACRYVGRTALLFVTSEQPPHGARAYCVRKLDLTTGEIDTLDPGLCGIATRSRAVGAMQKAATELAAPKGGGA
jgi:hypothetical protein